MTAILSPPSEQTRLTEFVRLHQRSLSRYARVLGCSAALADELVQDALVIAWQRGAISGVVARDAGFLRKVLRDRWVDEHRRSRRALRYSEAVEQLWVEEPDDDRWLAALAACRDALAGRSQAVLAATYDRGLGRDEVAAELGMKPNGIKTLLQRTRAALRDCVLRRLGEQSK